MLWACAVAVSSTNLFIQSYHLFSQTNQLSKNEYISILKQKRRLNSIEKKPKRYISYSINSLFGFIQDYFCDGNRHGQGKIAFVITVQILGKLEERDI